MRIQRKRQTATRSSPQSIRETEESANIVHECSPGKQSTQWEGALSQQSGGPGQDSLVFLAYLLLFFLIIIDYHCTILRGIEQNTIIGGQLLFNIVLASATHHDSVTYIPSLLNSLPSPSPSHHSRLSQNIGLSSRTGFLI